MGSRTAAGICADQANAHPKPKQCSCGKFKFAAAPAINSVFDAELRKSLSGVTAYEDWKEDSIN